MIEGGSAEAGWTSYPILTVARWATPGSLNGQTLWLAALLFAGISSLMGSINYITTIIMLRAGDEDVPDADDGLGTVHHGVASGVRTAGLDRGPGDATARPHCGDELLPALQLVGGQRARRSSAAARPLMWQHLFWFYSHPAVYIMILPAMGFVSDIISTFSRKPLFGYKPMVFAIAGIAGLGFIVWGHHMFQSGMNPALGATFMLSTMMIALPSAVKVFNWLGTMWGGRLQYTSAMLNAMAFVAMFIIGGLSGIFMAATPVDIHIHDTYFIVATSTMSSSAAAPSASSGPFTTGIRRCSAA